MANIKVWPISFSTPSHAPAPILFLLELDHFAFAFPHLSRKASILYLLPSSSPGIMLEKTRKGREIGKDGLREWICGGTNEVSK